MNEKKEIRLNIGAGRTYIPGFTNIDISTKADITMDLGKEKLPFDDDSVDIVFSYHALEHVPDYLFALSEIHRVLKHRGLFLVGLPYVTLTEYHLVNPYHLHNFNEFSFDFFNSQRLKGSAVEGNQIYFDKVFHRFHYICFFNLIPPPFRTWCRRHLFNVVRKIDFGLIAIKLSDKSSYSNNKKDIIQQFDKFLNSRKVYGMDSSDQNKKWIHNALKLIKRIDQWWRGHG